MMWKLYFYGELASPGVDTLDDLAHYLSVFRLPHDLEWFEMAPIEWEQVNKGYVYRQFAGLGEPPPLKLVHG